MNHETVPLTRRWSFWLLVLFLLARYFLVYVAFLHPERPILIDSTGYLDMRDWFLQFGNFSPADELDRLRTPGYPLILAVIAALLGPSAAFVTVFQVSLTLGTAALILLIGREFGSQNVGLAGAWLYALNPNAAFWSFIVLTETIFTFGITASVFALLRGLKHGRPQWLFVSGLLLGASIIIRPIGLYLVPLWLVFVLVYQYRIAERRYPWKAVGLFLLGALPLVILWQSRNYAKFGSFSLSSTTRVTIMNFIVADALAEAENITRTEAREIILNQDDPMQFALETAAENPLSLAVVTVRGLARTALGTEVGTWTPLIFSRPYESRGLLTGFSRFDFAAVLQALRGAGGEGGGLGLTLLVWGVFYTSALFILAALGSLKAIRRREPFLNWSVALLAFSAMYIIVVPLANGDARFRVPAEPLLALLGGLFWLKDG